jgi:hypothetical protein
VFWWGLGAVLAGLTVRRWWVRRRRGRRPAAVPADAAARRAAEVDALVRRAIGPHAFVAPAGGADPVEALCRRTGTLILRREGGEYWVRPPCATRGQSIRLGAGGGNVLFQHHLGVEFPLDREPPGLFARLLLRNLDLSWTAWSMTIAGRCDAHLSVSARIPIAGLDAALFDAVCREIVGEVEGFHRELHDKFRWGGGGMGEPGAAGPPLRGGVPMRRSWDGDLPDVRYPGE